MSDQTPVTPAEAAPNPVVANATQALAIKELGEAVTAVKKQVKTLWISFAALAVVTVVLLVLTFVPSLRFGLAGGNRGQFFRGQNGTGTFQGAPGGTQGGATGGQGGATGGQGVTTP
jgi:hypothetical protein